ncbi:hypothetical protein [Pseudooceanicola atlanticus]|uniref:hypothetical protein n=1 Tax=Pseudooceanicola atlanticus TaxID=1461694 RepID=UPI0023529A10|nr:hypothetical protein [Pseudooceanicola atlanticus]
MIEALRKTEAKGSAALALYLLSDRADEKGEIAVSVRDIATEIGYNRKAVHDALQALIDLGDIEMIDPGAGTSSARYLVKNRITANPEGLQEQPAPFRQSSAEDVVASPRIGHKPLSASNTGGIRATFRATIQNLDHLLTWCRQAEPGAVCIYHIGLIAADRALSQDLNAIAHTVALFSSTGYLVCGQHMISLPAGRQIAYTASKSGQGYAPRAVMAGKVQALDYTALQAVMHRRADLSATRAIRNDLGVSEEAAERILRSLARRRLIQSKGLNAGWEVTATAREMIQ